MLTFILGGARSGKSELAANLAVASGRDVLFVATMRELDDEMRARVAAHRAARPRSWCTAEAPVDLAAGVKAQARGGEFVLIDCVTAWISNILLDALPDPEGASNEEVGAVQANVADEVAALATWAAAFAGEVAIVSNDVGSGVVPPYALGRIFRDATGAANKTLAATAARAFYVVAGLALDLKALGAGPIDAAGRAR